MKNLPYKVKIRREEDHNAARRWCKKVFGDIPVKEFTVKVYPYSRVRRVYDNTIWTWVNKASSTPDIFRFEKPEDAAAFKLVWG